MNKNLIILVAGLLLGALVGWQFGGRTKSPQNREDGSKSTHPNVESWLFPREVTLADIFPAPLALEILRAPQRITLHKFGKRDLTVGGHLFDAAGKAPGSDDTAALLTCLRSLNAYTPVSACAFDPGVLIRLEKNGHRLDLLICFSCEDMTWLLDGEPSAGGAAIGLSDIGIASLNSVFRRAWPDETFFRKP